MKKRALVLQSGGSTAVINRSLAGVIEEVKRSRQFSHLYGSRFGILGTLQPNWIDLSSLRPTVVERLKATPSSALGSCRRKINLREAFAITHILRQKKIDVIFIIGGNDTAQTGLLLSQVSSGMRYDLQVIGIPKTIDNDLAGMDHAPGYGSVARFFAQTTQEASLDTKAIRSSDPIKIIETMGRDSGWIVAASSLGKKRAQDGPHLLYFPERAFNQKRFIADVRKVYQRYGFAVIVISETIRDKKGCRIGSANKTLKKDQFGHVYIEGAAQYLCNVLQSKLGVRARFDKPGTIQRMSLAYISKVDQQEAVQCGRQAVRFARRGLSGVMVAIMRLPKRRYAIRYEPIPLEVVAGCEKLLPNRFINQEGNFVTRAFRDYALPLTGNIPSDYTSFI